MLRILKRALLGCMILCVAAILVIAVTAGVMVSLGPPGRHPEESTRRQVIETPPLPEAASPASGEVSVPPAALAVRLDLSDGQFRVRRGEPGEGVRIDAQFDAGVYALEQEHQSIAAGVETVTIRFRSKYSFMRRLLTLGDLDVDNRISIYLPPDVPLRLQGSIKRGASRLDLSGLALTGIDLDLEMGEHRLEFHEANPLGMEAMRLRLSKGEFRSKGLGNAGFRTAEILGSMGEARVDLRGNYRHDATVHTRWSMGEMRVTVPTDVHLRLHPGGVLLGERRTVVHEDDDLPEDAPTLEIRSSMSLGELSIRSR